MYDQIVESFKRLYMSGKIDENKLDILLTRGIISYEDKEYIIGKAVN